MQSRNYKGHQLAHYHLSIQPERKVLAITSLVPPCHVPSCNGMPPQASAHFSFPGLGCTLRLNALLKSKLIFIWARARPTILSQAPIF